MKRTILCLGVAALGATLAAAAPAPEPPSEGPVSDALRVQRLLPNAAPPTVTAAVAAEGGVIELERQTTEMVTQLRTRKVDHTVAQEREEAVNVVGPDGQLRTVKVTVTVYVPVESTEQFTVTVPRATGAKVSVAAKSCKFFTVTKEGKLDPLDAAKATAMLKTRTPVLTGAGADVDPRGLELFKPGLLYLVLPPDQLPQETAPPDKGKE